MSFDIIGDLGIPSETTSWLSFLEKLKESHPDGVFMIIFYLVGCETKFSIVFLLMLVAVFLFIYPKMTLISVFMPNSHYMVNIIFDFPSAKQLS